MNYKAKRGTFDILPKDEDVWNIIQKLVLKLRYGYNYIETPIFEDSKLFERTVGIDKILLKRNVLIRR